MEKIKLAAILFFIFIFSFVNYDLAFAHEESEIPLSAEEESIKYDLPYPGLLPDNPLYRLKAIRDKVVSFMISDPIKKAEFNLLQADKRLNAGLYLFNKDSKNIKNINLAVSTISKGENYFGEALEKIKEGKMQGINTVDLERNLLTSSKKHQEIIMSIEKKTSGDTKKMFESQRKRVEAFEKDVSDLLFNK